MRRYEGRRALVTGASAGLGAAFARALAAEGADLVLTARRGDRLQALAAELSSAHGVSCEIVTADMADPAAPETVMAAAGDIDILINNAGYGLPGAFVSTSWTDQRDFMAVMATSYTHLVHLALPGMVERGYGRIINVASLAGLVPGGAGHTLYGAVKAMLVSFSQSLSAETRGTGVQVSALCPGFTYTEFHDVNGTRDQLSRLPKFVMQDAETVVRGALAAVERDHTVYVPGLFNKVAATVARLLPRPLVEDLAVRQSSQFRRTD